ncbi:MAG: hypothetical protein JNL88_12540 [Bacteroidia bacterium]|nr:hypothetical protein [Bacteroidia bacterium]
MSFPCFALFLSLLPFLPLQAQRLEPFGAESGKRESATGVRRQPYEKVFHYFEWVEEDNIFLSRKNDKDLYTAYFFVPDSLQELGVRVLSPVPELISPNKGHFATEAYQERGATQSQGFDPVVRISRAERRTPPEKWLLLAENDNNTEMPVSSSSILRLLSGQNVDKLPPGLYKIEVFAAQKQGLRGAFLLQLGSIPPLSDLQFSNTPSSK